MTYNPLMLSRLRQKDMGFSDSKQESFLFWVSITTLAMIGALVAVFYAPLVGLHKDFYNELWAPAYLLVHGRSPYDTVALNTALPAVWFPMAIGVFFPLGFLSENTATFIWFLFNILALLGMIYFSIVSIRLIYIVSLAAFFAFLFPPVLNHFALGQFTLIAVLCILFALFFAQRHYDWTAAFFLTLALSKPQLGVLAVFGMVVFYFHNSGVVGVLRFCGRCLLMAVLMSMPLFISYPAWIADCIKSMRSNLNWLQPSLFSMLRVALGPSGFLIWGAITAIVFICYYKIIKIFPILVATMWGLALTTLVSPYLWSWDFVLLLPIWIYTFSIVNWPKKILLIIPHLTLWWLMSLLRQSGHAVNQVLWWIPLWILIPLALVTRWQADKTFPD